MTVLTQDTFGHTLPTMTRPRLPDSVRALCGGRSWPADPALRRAYVDALLRGGVDGIGGLHEKIRYSATMVVDGVAEGATDDERAEAAQWVSRLGRHVPPHVTRDAQGRVTAVRYDA